MILLRKLLIEFNLMPTSFGDDMGIWLEMTLVFFNILLIL